MSAPPAAARRRAPRLVGGALWCASGLIALLLGALACSDPVPAPDMVAEIGDERVSHQAFESFLERNSTADAGVLGSDVSSDLLDRFIDELLLVRLAVERYSVEPDRDTRAVIAELLSAELVLPDDHAVAIYYQQNIARFELPQRVHVRQILFTDYDLAAATRNLWAVGMPYEKLVEQLESNPSARVGPAAELLVDELPAEFVQVLTELEEGEVSEIVAAAYGFHVVQLVRRLPAGTVPLSEVADEIALELSQLQGQSSLERLVEEARERYNVRVFRQNLPFNYEGVYPTVDIHESAD